MHSLHSSPSFASTGQLHLFGKNPHLKNAVSATVWHDSGQRQTARMSCTFVGFSFLESLNLPVHDAHCAPWSVQAGQPQNVSVEFLHVVNSWLIAAHEQSHGSVLLF